MKQNGTSLIELMIALLLAAFLTSLLLQHYLSIKSHYMAAQQTLRQHNELLWISELLRTSIRHAGFTPCANANDLQGIDQRLKGSFPPSLNTQPFLQIGRMSEHYTSVIRAERQQVFIGRHLVFNTGQQIMIADCFHAEIRDISFVSHFASEQSLHFQTPLAFDYIEPIFVGEWLDEQFVVRTNSQGENALFYHQQRSEELSDLINEMKVQSNPPLVIVSLLLKNGESLLLKTRVRGV